MNKNVVILGAADYFQHKQNLKANFSISILKKQTIIKLKAHSRDK